MFVHLFLHEIRFWLRKPAVYLYALGFLAVGFIMMAGNAGLFNPNRVEHFPPQYVNSPYAVYDLLKDFGRFLMFLVPAVIGLSLYRDFREKSHLLHYSFPIPKTAYLSSKFLSAYLITCLIALMVPCGMLVAEFLPGLHDIGPHRFDAYLDTYLAVILPNLLMYGVMVFAVIIWTRNIYAAFGSIMILMIVQGLVSKAFANQPEWMLMLDPFADFAVGYETQSWTLAERNEWRIPMKGWVSNNRALWLGISLILGVLGYARFHFHAFGFQWRNKRKAGRKVIKHDYSLPADISFPAVTYEFQLRHHLKSLWYGTRFHLGFILRNRMFWLLTGLAMLTVWFFIRQVTVNNEIALLPVTRMMLSIPAFFFTSIVTLLTFLVSGMLAHRARKAGIAPLDDINPIPEWVMLGAQTTALFLMQLILLAGLVMVGISIQLAAGYFQPELSLYLFHILLIIFPTLAIWGLAATLVHNFIPNLYLAVFLLLAAWVGFMGLPQMGIHTRLLNFNGDTWLDYSDLNGYGSQLPAFFLVKTYWFLLSGLGWILALLLYKRGQISRWQEHFYHAKKRLSPSLIRLCLVLLLSVCVSGFYIWQGEQKIVSFTSNDQKAGAAAYQELFGRFQDAPQPRIASLDLALDFYPSENRFSATGSYQLINQTTIPIDTLLIRSGFDEESSIDIQANNHLIIVLPEMKSSLYALQKPLLPGDSIQMNFSIQSIANSLFQRNNNILHNASFIISDILPRIGFNPKLRTREMPDSLSRLQHYQGNDADWIRFQATLSTASDQMAFAPGHLLKQWTEEGRNYFTYQSPVPIKFSLGFLSGTFAKHTENWQGMTLEVYHHPMHEESLPNMMSGLKAALQHFDRSAYPFSEIRLVPFPQSRGTFATAFANLMPVSEIRFIADNRVEEGKIDLGFYVIAHELGHHWWGNLLMPADAPGALMLTESITEYHSLNIYADAYGEAEALQFARKQRIRYLRGRSATTKEEPPLAEVKSFQQYLAYGKGSLVLRSLAHRLGRDTLDQLLQRFREQHPGPPYPLATDLLSFFHQSCPDSLQNWLSERFEQVGLYDIRLNDAKLEGSELVCDVFFSKSDGMADSIATDWLEVALYNDQGEQIALQEFRISPGQNMIRFPTEAKPARAVLDPQLYFIEKNVDNNSWDVP
ncbi:MAG: M1 family aminopeptidase [Bacteroidota bacterium]